MNFLKQSIFFLLLLIYCFSYADDKKTPVIDTSTINFKNTLAKKYKSKYNKRALKYANEALKYSIELDYQKGEAESYFNIGDIYTHQARYLEAKDFYTKALYIYNETENKKEIANCFSRIGKNMTHQKKYVDAISYYLKALKINETINYKEGISDVYNRLGMLHNNQKDYEKALIYYRKSLIINQEEKNQKKKINNYGNIANVYSVMQKYDSAFIFYSKAISIAEETESIRKKGIILNNIGELYKEKKEYHRAIKFYKQSLEVAKKIKYPRGISICYANLGETYLLLDKYHNAVIFLKKSMKIAEEIKFTTLKAHIYLHLSKAEEKLNNYKNAYEYHKKLKILTDSLQKNANSKKITELEMNYKFDQKQKVQAKEYQLLKKFTIAFSIALFITLFISFLLYKNFKAKKKANLILAEQKEEIQSKNVELEQQTEEIISQKDEIEKQKDLLTKQNKEIKDSIYYARRIQRAILSPSRLINSLLSDNFILYLPKDIVSGDFYWIARKNHKVIVVVGDCTGHGVPGGFMSMLGISSLNEIVNRGIDIQANEILDQLRNKIKLSLNQTGKEHEASDGMDLSLCIIDFDNLNMQFSGANNPVFLLRDEKLIVFKGDKMPIGIHPKETSFTKKEINLKIDDVIYLFSDGYQDQFGGTKGRKFLVKRFKETLLEIHKKSMPEQKELLKEYFFKWKGELDQIDDILIMGIKI